MNGSFLQRFVSGLIEDCFSFQAGNFDELRFGPETDSAGPLKTAALKLLNRAGFARRRFNPAQANQALEHILTHAARYQAVYEGFGDEPSKALFVDLLRFRVLGHQHTRLPSNNAAYQELRAELDSRHSRGTHVRAERDWQLKSYEFAGREGPIVLDQHAYGFCLTFAQEHYSYAAAGISIEAQAGETILDAGGCWGDTALYFADRAGCGGHVVCFEFDPANLEILQTNLAKNPALKPRIEVISKALWHTSGREMAFNSSGPCSRLEATASGAASVQTVTIDAWVKARGLARVDFIKMDIEGAELSALQGATETLLRDRPKLAISLYHKPEDFIEIPEFLRGLDAGYSFYLGHKTIHAEETVLFAQAQ